MSKNKRNIDIKNKSGLTETKPKEDVEVTSNKEESENTAPIEEVTKNSSNNKEELEEVQQENLEEVTQPSTSPPVINTDESKGSNETNSTESEKENTDTVKTDSDKTINQSVIPVVNPKIETIIFDEPLCKIVEVQEFTSDGTMERYQYIEAKIECITYKRIIPNMFYYKKGGYLIGLIPTKNGFDEVFLSDYPIIPLYIMENVTTSEEYLRFAIHRRRTWLVTISPSEELYNKAVKLSKFGVKITSKNGAILGQYFSDFCMQKLPCKYVTNHLGWHNSNKDYVPYSANIELLSDNPFSSKGTLQEWVNAFAPFRKNTTFRIIMAAGFSAPLLKLVKERPFMLYVWAPSRTGKTAALAASTTIFGSYKDLMKNYNSTMVGLEKALQMFSDVVFALDEKMISDSQKTNEKIAFMISSQSGRTRANKFGGLDKNSTFMNLTISTGEEEFAKDNTTMGVVSRVLEVKTDKIFESESQASLIYKLASDYYGTAGKVFINNLIENYSNNNYEELQTKLEKIKSRLEKESTSDVRAYITSIAVIVLGDILSSKWIFNEDNEEASIQMGVTILNQLKKSNEMDEIDTAYDEVKEYIITNHKYFSVYTQYVSAYKPEDDISESSFCLGLRDGNIYYILRKKLKDFLQKNNYDYLKITQGFADRKYIRPSLKADGSFKTTTVQKKFKNVNLRFFAFPIEGVLAKPGELEKKFPIGMKTEDFETLRKEGNLYVRQPKL